MNKHIKRASWDENIMTYDAHKTDRTNNIIIGIGIGVMIAGAGVIYLLAF